MYHLGLWEEYQAGNIVVTLKETIMMTNRQAISLGRILGIPIGLDYSWFLIFALVTWMLAASYLNFAQSNDNLLPGK
jgi:hypothetical protein